MVRWDKHSKEGYRPHLERSLHPTLQQCDVTLSEELTHTPPSFDKWLGHSNPTDHCLTSEDGCFVTYKALLEMLTSCSLQDGTPIGMTNERFAILVPPTEPELLALCLAIVIAHGSTACPIDPSKQVDRMVESIRDLKCTAAIVGDNLKRETRCAVDSVLSSCYEVQRRSPSTFATASTTGHAWGTLEWRKADSGNGDGQSDGRINAYNSSSGMRSSKRKKKVLAGLPTPPPSTVSLVLQTSGTTGHAKNVPITYRGLYINTMAIARSLRLTCTDVCVNAMPLFHIGGITCPFLATLRSGGSVRLVSPFSPADFVSRIHKSQGVTWYYAAPTIHKSILVYLQQQQHHHHQQEQQHQHQHQHQQQPSSNFALKFVRSGAAHLNHADAVALSKLLGCSVLPTYSMSECMPVCSVPVDWDLSLPNTVGKPIAPSMRIGDENGAALGYGEVGEVMVCGPGVSAEYEGEADDATSSTRHHPMRNDQGYQWLRTGDRGSMDREGNVVLQGRAKEVAKRGGEQVSLFEVDQALVRHGAVETCVAFSIPNQFWGEEIAAAVVPTPKYREKLGVPTERDSGRRSSKSTRRYSDNVKDNRTDPRVKEERDKMEREIKDFVKTKTKDNPQPLESYKVPFQIFFVEYSDIPKTASGKYRRHELCSALDAQSKDTAALTTLQRASGDNNGALSFDSNLAAGKASRRGGVVTNAPSKGLYGLRFFMALWVAHIHIGHTDFSWNHWPIAKLFSINIPTFMFLAGFQLSSSTSRTIGPGERLEFYVSRLSATHPLFLFTIATSTILKAVVYAISLGDAMLNVFVFSTGFGNLFSPLYPANTPAWFQSSMYVFFILYPFTDNYLRQASQTKLWLTIPPLLTLSHLGGVSFQVWDWDSYTNPANWISMLVLGQCMFHIYRYHNPRPGDSTRVACLSDSDANSDDGDEDSDRRSGSSSHYSASPSSSQDGRSNRVDGSVPDSGSEEEGHGEEPGERGWRVFCRRPHTKLQALHSKFIVCVRPVARQWEEVCVHLDRLTLHPHFESFCYWFWPITTDLISLAFLGLLVWMTREPLALMTSGPFEGEKRYVLGLRMGQGRWSLEILMLWIYGIAKGRGLTARLCSLRPLVQQLSPLAYPMYLLHAVVGLVFNIGYGHDEPRAGRRLENYYYFIVLGITLPLAWLFNEFVNPRTTPIMMVIWRKVFKLVQYLFSHIPVLRMLVSPAPEYSNGTSPETTDLRCSVLVTVQLAVRRLNGCEITEDSRLDEIGLDSFGTTALLGAIRSVMPEAKALRPIELLKMSTVADLVNRLSQSDGLQRLRQDEVV